MVTKDETGDYGWAVYDDNNRAVSQSFPDRKQARAAAIAYIKRTGKFANVTVTDGDHEGEVDWQPWWNEGSKQQFCRENGIKLKRVQNSLHKAMMVGVAKAKREKALAYPSDPDGGGRRVAAITTLERKLAMMERDLALGMVEASRVEKVRQQLADAKDSTKPLK